MNSTSSWLGRGVAAAGALVALIVGCSNTPGQTPQTCSDGETLCGKECLDTATDPGNCGACGNACKPGEVCGAGVCSLTCGTGSTQCGASCFDTNVDSKNCGACGNACSAGQICAGGKCAAQCPSQQTLCVGDGGATSCVNPNTDAKNCGGCGTVCDPGKVCGGGVCGDTCGVNELLCKPNNMPYCAAVQTDNGNCGSCGNVCSAGQTCVGGKCTGNCGLKETLCPGGDGGAGYCAKTDTDQANCGACGNACNNSNGEVCVAGKCILQCGAGLTSCGKECVDTNTNRDNCGGCNNPCTGNTPSCVNGKCSAKPPAYVYTDNFLNNQNSPTQCTHWQTWIAGLGNSYTSVTFSGSLDNVGITCNVPAVVQNMAAALKNQTAYTAVCNGHTWSNCNRYNDELWIDPPMQCSGANCPSPGYILRPCIGNSNWGGVNGPTCGGANQSMTLSFQ